MHFLARKLPVAAAIIGLSALLCLPAAAAVFSKDRQVVFYDGATATRANAKAANSELEVAKTWGQLADGRAVVTLNAALPLDPDAVEGHSHKAAGEIALVESNGTTNVLKDAPEALRVFPSPTGTALAIITPSRDLLLYESTDSFANSKLTTITINGRVSHASWSHDGSLLAAAVYPPDFTPEALDNARNPEEFLRLQNSDIYLIDGKTGTVVRQITNDEGTEYNPFFSPDSKQLYFIGLALHDNSGGLKRIHLNAPETTPTLVKNTGNAAENIPLGRVGTYLFSDDNTLIFEGGLPDGSGEIWRMKTDGSGLRKIRTGRHPQKLNNGNIAIIDEATPGVISREEVQQ